MNMCKPKRDWRTPLQAFLKERQEFSSDFSSRNLIRLQHKPSGVLIGIVRKGTVYDVFIMKGLNQMRRRVPSVDSGLVELRKLDIAKEMRF